MEHKSPKTGNGGDGKVHILVALASRTSLFSLLGAVPCNAHPLSFTSLAGEWHPSLGINSYQLYLLWLQKTTVLQGMLAVPESCDMHEGTAYALIGGSNLAQR